MSADRHPQRTPPTPDREWLSRLADGDAAADELEQACKHWRSSPDMQADWHAYHLIGDVMRSDELSSRPARDAAFLQALRTRLVQEPVPLAPMPVAADGRARDARVGLRSRRWLAPAAAVAGVAAVGVSVLVMRSGPEGPTGWGQPMAVVQPSGGEALRRVVNAPTSAASSQSLVIDGQVIRDARLDAYFEAHRGAAGPMPSAVPGGALRSVEILVPQR